MKITEYPAATTLAAADVFLTDGVNGTKKLAAQDALFAILDGAGLSQMHRNVFRGKNLGTSFTAAQKTAVQNGTFKDLYVGDYWLIGGVKYRIADINYYLNQGNPRFGTNHLVIWPDKEIASGAIYPGSNVRLDQLGGYSTSEMRKTTLASLKSTLNTTFSNSVLDHTEHLNSGITSNGLGAANVVTVTSVELPTCVQVYGSHAWTSMSRGDYFSDMSFGGYCQLALTQMAPQFIVNETFGKYYWTREHASVNQWTHVETDGSPGYGSPNLVSNGVRPIFCIG